MMKKEFAIRAGIDMFHSSTVLEYKRILLRPFYFFTSYPQRMIAVSANTSNESI